MFLLLPDLFSAPPNRPFSSQRLLESCECPLGALAPNLGNTGLYVLTVFFITS